MSPQCRDLLRYLESKSSITPLEALGSLGIYRLAARISDLRAAGYPIKSELVTTHSSRYAVYTLERKPVQVEMFG